MKPANAAGKNFFPVKIARLQLGRRFVAAIIKHHRSPDALAAVAVNGGHIGPVDTVVFEIFVKRTNTHGFDAFSNQFELPVLFYVLTILAIVTRHADVLFVVMAWIFVAFRILQAWVHVTGNNVRFRGAFYGMGALVLLAMWIIFIVRILLGLP